MKKLFVIVATVFAGTTAIVAQTQAHTPEQQVRQVVELYRQALLKNDVPAVQKLVAEDAVYTYGTRSEPLSVAHAGMKRLSSTPRQASNTSISRVTVHGNTAIVMGRQWFKDATTRGGDRFQFKHILSKQGDDWKIVEIMFDRETP